MCNYFLFTHNLPVELSAHWRAALAINLFAACEKPSGIYNNITGFDHVTKHNQFNISVSFD